MPIENLNQIILEENAPFMIWTKRHNVKPDSHLFNQIFQYIQFDYEKYITSRGQWRKAITTKQLENNWYIYDLSRQIIQLFIRNDNQPLTGHEIGNELLNNNELTNINYSQIRAAIRKTGKNNETCKIENTNPVQYQLNASTFKSLTN